VFGDIIKQEFSWPLFDVCMLTYQTVVRSGGHLDTVDHDQIGTDRHQE